MHITRQEATKKLPIPRKGSKYLARTFSDIDSSVSVVAALRDMLKIAATAKEVKTMIINKAIKINGRVVYDYRESIKLFNLLEAGKTFKLTLLPTGKFTFEQVSDKTRLCKVTNKRLVEGNQIQLNLHDGSNVISKEKISVGDSVYLDLENKIKSVVPLNGAKKGMLISGKYLGQTVAIQNLEGNKITVKLANGESAVLNKNQVVVI
jgi:ribosomal protein S4E